VCTTSLDKNAVAHSIWHGSKNIRKRDCGGIMGKSKQVAKCAPSCSAVQFGGQDKPWTGMAGALVEQQHMFVIFKTKSLLRLSVQLGQALVLALLV
jgi:hypothetical protein